MRRVALLVAVMGLSVATAATARADVVCAQFNTMNDAGKMAAVREAAAAGNPIAQISPQDAVALATAMCRVRLSETVTEVLNSKG